MSFLGDLITAERSQEHWHSSAFYRAGAHISHTGSTALNHTLLITHKGRNTKHTHDEQVQTDSVCEAVQIDIIALQLKTWFNSG